ncbi:MAG: sporulation protein YunB [Ruminococcus sp.]|nr:sporulation protein YunB [Ruminococcus sp.]
MRCRRKLSKTQRKIRKYISIFISLILIAVFLFEFSVKRQLTAVLITQLKMLIETSVTQAVEDFFSQNQGVTDDLAELHYSSSGVQAISTDSEKINKIKAGVSSLSQDYIDTAAQQDGVDIPLGELTGLVLFSQAGPSIHLSISSKQVVKCVLQSSFESAGINQTIHHITLNVETEVTVYNPYRIREPIETETSYEIAQTVIVGSVPSYSGVVTY